MHIKAPWCVCVCVSVHQNVWMFVSLCAWGEDHCKQSLISLSSTTIFFFLFAIFPFTSHLLPQSHMHDKLIHGRTAHVSLLAFRILTQRQIKKRTTTTINIPNSVLMLLLGWVSLAFRFKFALLAAASDANRDIPGFSQVTEGLGGRIVETSCILTQSFLLEVFTAAQWNSLYNRALGPR